MKPVDSLAAILVGAVSASALAQPNDATRGERDFRACAPCHSLEPGRNMTGPSLAGLWGRKAGGLASFVRYSDALKSSGIVWEDRSLDAWLTDPQAMVPDNAMPFEGIKNAAVRVDLVAFLKRSTKPEAASDHHGQTGAMAGMMGGGRDPDLKTLEPARQIKSISYCHDTYQVTTTDGKTRAFWERNLRFITDSSKDGPERGAPAIMPAGMLGDRAAAIFSSPEEIAKFVEPKC